MDKINLENEEREQVKKDFHPIWIYIVSQILVSIVVVIFAIAAAFPQIESTSKETTNITEDVNIKEEIADSSNEIENIVQEKILEASNIGFLCVNAVLFFIFVAMYLKRVKADIKRVTKKNVIFVLIVTVIGVCLNFAISALFEYFNVAMNNQDTLSGMMDAFAIPTAILTVLLAPFIEEIVFRYSLGTLIKNKVVFVIVSSILFGLVHGVGIAMLLYVLLGAIFSIIYIKTDKNIVASTSAHMINNLIGTIIMFI